ncbi:DUF3857 domain-containing protein [Aestuariivivens insulae]|uniref:DUF3857 domain-containing protein n=1 Tax=Aestuariivivens insulae TaxID=1621988 RepID=UPI001F55D356|nr:DUF3857 domain-containing protein [Aestuariivivens insulae]
MMQKKAPLLLLIFFSIACFGQSNYNPESYRVTLGDIESKTYEKDSTATALVIYEAGNSYVDQSNYRLNTEVKHKIKILTKEGFDKATITIYLYNKGNKAESVKNIIATTYNKEGHDVTKHSLDKAHIYEEKYDENHTLVKFTLPNVKAGSVITYSYTIVSPYMFKYKGWNFQGDIPKLYSDYKTSIPANWYYNVKLVGYKKLDIQTSDIKKRCLEGSRGAYSDCSVSHYAMKDIPAFIEEDYMTHQSNYLARIEYELMTFKNFEGQEFNYTKSWKTVDKEFRTDKDIGRQLSKSIKLEDFFDAKLVNEPDLYLKANTIYKFIQDNYTWNGKFRIFEDVSVKDLIKNKTGNVSSINILLHNLLNEAGIDAKPVLASTRNNGFPTKIYPVISDFNYVIVQATIDSKTYLLDATDDYLSFGEVPFRCLNSYGRLMDFEKGSEWIDIKPKGISAIYYNMDLAIDDDGIISGTVKSKTTGYHALSDKKNYFSNSESYLEKLQDKFLNAEVYNLNVDTEDKTSFDFVKSYAIEYNIEDTGDNTYLNPFFIKFFKENPFKLQERTYPIDFGYEDSYFFLLNLNLGDQYELVEQPEDASLVLPNNAGRIVFSTKLTNNTLHVLLRIEFKSSQFSPEYYPYLKEFMNKVVSIQNNSLILLKRK